MLNQSGEFLARVRLALEDDATRGLKQFGKTADQMAGKQIDIPWLKNVPAQAKQAGSAITDFSDQLKGFTQVGTRQNTIWQDGVGVGSKMTKIYKNQAGAVQEVTSVVDKNGKVTSNALKSVSAGAAKGAGAMAQLGMAMRRAIVVAPVWLILRSAMMGVLSLVKDNIKFLFDLETAMTRIKIVGKGTAEEYTRLQNTLVVLSKVYGVSASDAVEAAKVFAQQGKSITETIQLTQHAMLASQVLGKDVKIVVEDLTAATKGFDIAASQSIGIIDKWINVEKNFAVTSKDLADATKAAGATAHALGITLSEYLGDVTAVIEVTRKTGSEAARGLSFIYARMFSTARKTIQEVARVNIYLDAQKKATSELTGVLRPASDVLGEIADKWKNLGKEERVELAAALGSKRQMVVVNALMQNYNRSMDARIKAITSAGQAEIAFVKLQDTIAFKIKQVSSGWNIFTNALLNTDGFKQATDAMNSFLITLTYVVNAEQGYRAEMSSTITKQKMLAETEMSAASNLKEVIELRDQLLSRPPKDETADRVKNLNNFIEMLSKKEPTIKIAVETGDADQIDEAIRDVQKRAILKKVVLDVQLEYVPKILDAKKLANSMSSKLTGSKANLEQGILNLYKEQAVATEEQYKAALAEFEIKEGIKEFAEAELEAREKLTEPEKEGLKFASKIALFNIKNKDNKEEQLKYEIELTKNLESQYTKHDRNLKVQQLQNALLEEQEELRQKEKDSLTDSFLKIAKIKGLTESSSILAEAALYKQIHGEEAFRKNLELRLKLEERITREKLNQVEVSDETVKLYNIAKKEGIDIARELGKFLTGGITLQQLQEMPRAFESFKRNFSERFEAYQAADFMGIGYRGKGKLGGPRLVGQQGSLIPIQEFEAQKGLRPIEAKVNAPVTVSGININVNAELLGNTKEEIVANLKKKIVDVIQNDAEADKALKDKIELF